MAQKETSKKSEYRVKQKLESFGLHVRKPYPDVGIDLEVFNPIDTSKYARIQVKSNEFKSDIKRFRWFQLRVKIRELELAKNSGTEASETWRKKVLMVDFFILDSLNYDEMWILSQEQTFELISLNEYQYLYGNRPRPDNVFRYEDPMKNKQKEMNLEARVLGIPIIKQLATCQDNFNPILNFLGI